MTNRLPVILVESRGKKRRHRLRHMLARRHRDHSPFGGEVTTKVPRSFSDDSADDSCNMVDGIYEDSSDDDSSNEDDQHLEMHVH